MYPIKHNTNFLILLVTMLILLMISINGPLLEQIESDLGNHMIVEHSLFFLIGYLSMQVSESILKSLVRRDTITKHTSEHMATQSNCTQTVITIWLGVIKSIYTISRNGLFPITCAIILVGFWHIPSIFDLSTYSEGVHLAQHVSFILVGMLFFVSLRQLGQSLVLFLIVSSVGMMLLSGLGLASTNERLYLSYSVHSHNVAGEYMLELSIAIAIVGLPVYLIHRTLFHISTISKSSSYTK